VALAALSPPVAGLDWALWRTFCSGRLRQRAEGHEITHPWYATATGRDGSVIDK